MTLRSSYSICVSATPPCLSLLRVHGCQLPGLPQCRIEGPLLPLSHPRSLPLRAYGQAPRRLISSPKPLSEYPSFVVETFDTPSLILNDLSAANPANCERQVNNQAVWPVILR